MPEQKKIKRIPREQKPKPTVEDNQKRHELGLLQILAQKYPEKAREIVNNLKSEAVW